MLEILILLEINSRYSFVNISIIFRLIIALLMNRKINSFSAMQECMHYELILFESIFNRAPPYPFLPLAKEPVPINREENTRGVHLSEDEALPF